MPRQALPRFCVPSLLAVNRARSVTCSPCVAPRFSTTLHCAPLPHHTTLSPRTLPADSFAPKRKKGDDDDDDGKGIVHDDVWCLDLKSLVFERVKKQGKQSRPRASRCSCDRPRLRMRSAAPWIHMAAHQASAPLQAWPQILAPPLGW